MEGGKKIIEEPWLSESALSSCLDNITRKDVEIVLLGTGSSQPSKYRNVISIFINLFSKGSLLLDCGEGTLGQLKRRFGIKGADDAVRGLRCIWISHIHADHHTDLARLLALRRDLLKGVRHEPIIVVDPVQLEGFLDAYEKLEDLDLQFLDFRHTTEASLLAFESNHDQSSLRSPTNYEIKDVSGKAGLESLISFPVVHCSQAFGIALKAADRVNSAGKTIPGWKIVYSGDTRPCPELVKTSLGATVLIHEATFEDGLLDEAIARNHSTTKEAIEVGNFAGAYRTTLAHISVKDIPKFQCLTILTCTKHALLSI